MAQKQLTPHSKDELRNSNAPKRTMTGAAPANPGMVHRVAGMTARGVSRTASNEALGRTFNESPPLGRVNGGEAITPAKEGHLARPAPVHSAFATRTPSDHETVGNRILAEGKLAAGK
jgi:hypothetical protein